MGEVDKIPIEVPGMNPVVEAALNQQIKQLKRLEPMLGKAVLQKQILATPMNQNQKDYVFQKMGWL